jgi:hypothetical protein
MASCGRSGIKGMGAAFLCLIVPNTIGASLAKLSQQPRQGR